MRLFFCSLSTELPNAAPFPCPPDGGHGDTKQESFGRGGGGGGEKEKKKKKLEEKKAAHRRAIERRRLQKKEKMEKEKKKKADKKKELHYTSLYSLQAPLLFSFFRSPRR